MSYVDDIPRHHAGEKCPGCNSYDKPKGGVLKEVKGKFGNFLGCNRYPDCKYTVSSFYTEKYKDEKYKLARQQKTGRKPSGNQKATSFKRNVPKRSRKEWGERMNFLRSI